MDKYLEDLKKMKLDIDGIYDIKMNYIIYEYECSCSEFCNCKIKLCYELNKKYTWIKKEVEKEIMKMNYLIRGITLIK